MMQEDAASRAFNFAPMKLFKGYIVGALPYLSDGNILKAEYTAAVIIYAKSWKEFLPRRQKQSHRKKQDRYSCSHLRQKTKK